MISRFTIPHPFCVASHFRPWRHAFWLALFHDAVEDGFAPAILCHLWPSLDAITRRDGEVYLSEYIPRVAMDDTASTVKIADLRENLLRCPASLRPRYKRALTFLSILAPPSTVASMASLLREPVTRSDLVKVRALAGQAIDHIDGRSG